MTFKKVTNLCLVVTLATFMLFVSQAQANRAGRGSRIHELFKLDLSSDQKGAIKDILDRYQPKRQALRENIKKARQQYRLVFDAETFNEADVRAAFNTMTPIREEMMVMRARMAYEMKAILTDEQLEQLKTRRAERAKKHQQRRKFGKKMLNTWLQMPAEK
jgi:Spy/CpxP family protein refolding chaperone